MVEGLRVWEAFRVYVVWSLELRVERFKCQCHPLLRARPRTDQPAVYGFGWKSQALGSFSKLGPF